MSIPGEKPAERFKHTELRLVDPPFNSPLTDLVIELDYLRKKSIGDTPSEIFMQIKDVFHFLESIGSARIEGNNTTVQEYVESKLEHGKAPKENIVEIANMESALGFIDAHVHERPIDRVFIGELHRMVVAGLTREGSANPGNYRGKNVAIKGTSHAPPPPGLVERYMVELFEFINRPESPKYDLIKTALAHHRFVWIHPFDNGNGRTVRLVTYAMLVKQGFNVSHADRIINPTAVFCSDRKSYYEFLARADGGTEEGLLAWTSYMLSGLKREIEKLDLLLDYRYLSERILLPALDYSLERRLITAQEFQMLQVVVRKQRIANSDIRRIMPDKDISDISKMIGRLKEKGMLAPVPGKKRIYALGFAANYLLRGIIAALEKNDFLPKNDPA